MTVNVLVGHRYLWLQAEVEAIAVEQRFATVRRTGSDAFEVVPVEALKPLPAPAELAASALMRVDQVEWDRASSIAGELRKILATEEGRTKVLREAAEKLGVGERQLWRLLDVFKANPTTTAVLRLKSGRPHGFKALGFEREAIVAKCIQEKYLRREKPSLSDLCEEIAKACRDAGLEPPARGTIAARVEALDLKERTRRREGGKAAKETCDAVPGHVEVTHALERVEIDHTLADIILRADTEQREVIGRPWITMAVDCGTRTTLGWYIGFERPSSASVAMCLAHACLPKDKWLLDLGVHGSFPAQGVMKQIWVDNAMEFRAEALRRGCEQHGIVLHFRPIGSPHFGGTIERLIGNMMGRVHLLPGTTQSNVQERGDYDAESRAVMTLSEFQAWFAEQVVTQYHLQEHRTIRKPPLVAWKEDTGGVPPKPPANELEFMSCFLPAETRVLRRTGIEMHRLFYWHDAFSAWVGHGKEVEVHYHPMDITRVHVRLPDGVFVTAEATNHDAPKISLSDWRRRLAEDRAIARDPSLVKERDAGRQRNEERLKAAQQATQKAKRRAPQPSEPEIPEAPEPAIDTATSRQPLTVYIPEEAFV